MVTLADVVTLRAEIDRLIGERAELRKQICSRMPGCLDYDVCHIADRQTITKLRHENARLKRQLEKRT